MGTPLAGGEGATPFHRQAGGGGARWPATFSDDPFFQKKKKRWPPVCVCVNGFLASVSFGWPHGGRAYMLGGFVGNTPVHADGVSFTQCYAWAS